MRPYIAVIGAGINGLSTAVQIQESLPSSDVTIIADHFERETTSDGAAGLFRPTVDYIPGVPRYLLKQWSQDSWAYYSHLAHSEEASDTGISILSGYHFFSPGQEEKDPIHREVIYHSRDLSVQDYHIFPGTDHCRSGFFFTTLIVESRWFLPWLMKRYKLNGGKTERRTVHSIEELTTKYDIVVNCSGARARELVNDDQVSPSRGQMIRVKAPWIKHCLYVDHNCWIIPGMETVTIGGTRQEGNSSTEISELDRTEMWERACKHMPSLRKAEWQWEWVGMRPARSAVRVEKQTMTFGQRSIPVVHNYGQGGSGISLGWGCSKHAARLVLEHVTQSGSRM